MALNESRFINKSNPSLADVHQSTSRPTKQEVLAAAGMVPGPTGMAADLMSAALYAKEGDWKNTLWSLASFLPIVGMAAGVKKIRSFQKLKNQRSTIETLGSRKLSKKGTKKLKDIKTEYTNYMDGSTKKSRHGKILGQKGNQNSKVVRDADRAKKESITRQLDELAEEEGGLIKAEYDKLSGSGQSSTYQSKKINQDEKEQAALDRLFREGQAGLTKEGVRIR